MQKRLIVKLIVFSLFGSPSVVRAAGETPLTKLCVDLQNKRKAIPGFHQEFEVTRKYKTRDTNQVSREDMDVDLSRSKWREQSSGGMDDLTRIFDGEYLYMTEPDSSEYVRRKLNARKPESLPEPYSDDLEWEQAKEIARQPCGSRTGEHTCLIVEAPVRTWMRPGKNARMTIMTKGMARVVIDMETGMWLHFHAVQEVEAERVNYQLDETYSVKRLSYQAPTDEDLFRLPSNGFHEVKVFTPWNKSRIKKKYLGKPAPDLAVTDVHGTKITLADLKGKTVLLDFWATWCPPCQADGSSLNKLHQRYGAKDLVIIGISVDEEREVVEKFLKGHSHEFPIVLTTENIVPRPYQINALPTYIVIAPDGTLAGAEEGDQGFAKLKDILGKAGMEAE